MRERDVLLEKRRPAAARGVAHLLAAGIDRHAHAPRRARQPRREADLGIQPLERVPFELDTDELPLRSARLLCSKRLAADEALLGEIHRPAEIELERRRELAVDKRFAR